MTSCGWRSRRRYNGILPVVPVLVRGARMPRAEQLPDDLKELAFRNAVELTHARWKSDVQVLVEALKPYLEPCLTRRRSYQWAARCRRPRRL